MSETLKTRARHVVELPTDAEDARINLGIATDPDSPELDEAWFERARPAAEVLPPAVYADLLALRRRPGQRGPQKSPTKQRIALRLSRDVLETFRASGEGWQTRIDEALREHLARQQDKNPA